MDAPNGSFAAVAAGFLEHCGLRTSGDVVCWGNSHNEQIYVATGSIFTIDAGKIH
ncbi:MAG: hypothetical protein F4070_04275 [Acidimicrobiales bacterium]|nr:hypothetical protein [Acidimicrobiales bacterium]